MIVSFGECLSFNLRHRLDNRVLKKIRGFKVPRFSRFRGFEVEVSRFPGSLHPGKL